MSPSGLSLFPSPESSVARKTSTKKNRIEPTTDEIKMRGVAFQVVTSSHKTAKVQPATDTIKHALFCDPSPSESGVVNPGCGSNEAVEQNSSSTGSPQNSTPIRRQSRTRRKSGPISTSPSSIPQKEGQFSEEDSVSDLPSNTKFTTTTPPRRSLSARSHSRVAPNLSTIALPERSNVSTTPVDETKDQLSPLPTKTRFSPDTIGAPPEYPHSIRSGSPVPSKASKVEDFYTSPSTSTSRSREEAYTSPMRSIFPVYDPSKPLEQQNYYPSPTASPPPAYLGNNVSKLGSPAERQNPQRYDSVIGLLDGYEQVPTAAHGDMQALYKASCEDFPVAGRKARFGLYQPTGHGKTLAIGTSHEDLIYCMDKDTTGVQAPGKQFAARKHCPTARLTSPVATFLVHEQTTSKTTSKANKEVTTIFPHAAAMHAIEAVLSTPEASHIATFDPSAQSPQAASLAQDAVTEAHRRYCCDLIKRTRKRDSLGSVTAHYDLVHPMLGTCPVTVTKSLSTKSISGPRAKISLHHPSATPAAVAADTLNLASIDFAHDACVLDIPGLLALDSHYIIDTVVSTLLAVAVIENDALVAETMVFEPPPKTPTSKKAARRASIASSKSKRFGRSGTKKSKKKEEVQGDVGMEQVELDGVAKGVLAVMELTFKASAWVILTGAKVGFGVVGYGVDKIQKRIA